ncbi:LLM class flavin-dependent oxidoreductase [Streptomyces sp. NPDC048002]|uniref:LLM class flavin-dependent oxidoreductase n=1 Tax=Streptomyces sp. NPDC048002 TaxID=3154344 RepID=UPI0033D598D3
MYFSVFLGPGVRGPAEDRRAIDLGIQQALEADEAGFSAVYLGEQHFNNYEPYSNPFMMAAYLAPNLRRAYLGTSVVPLVLHHPLFMVEQCNLLDQLTQGRAIIGMSGGRPRQGRTWHKHDLSSEQRSRLFEQKLDVMLSAWAHRAGDPPLHFATDDEQGVMDGRIMPYSYRDPHPLYAIGTNTPAKIAEAGRLGRKVHLGPFDSGHAGGVAQLYRTSMEEAGHSPDVVEDNLRWLIHTKIIYVGETDSEAWDVAERLLQGPMVMVPWLKRDPALEGMPLRDVYRMDPGEFAPAMGMPESLPAYLRRMFVIGSPETVAGELAAYEKAGLSHLHARFIFGDLDVPDVFQRSFRLFTQEVMPRLGVDVIPGPSAAQVRPEFRNSR